MIFTFYDNKDQFTQQVTTRYFTCHVPRSTLHPCGIDYHLSLKWQAASKSYLGKCDNPPFNWTCLENNIQTATKMGLDLVKKNIINDTNFIFKWKLQEVEFKNFFKAKVMRSLVWMLQCWLLLDHNQEINVLVPGILLDCNIYFPGLFHLVSINQNPSEIIGDDILSQILRKEKKKSLVRFLRGGGRIDCY